MDTPILDMLKSYKSKNRISFCMPGHKGGEGLVREFSSFSLDVTELEDTDNLIAPKSSVKRALENVRSVFSSDESFFLVNGSTGGIHTMIASVCGFGDSILVSRSCHSSVINACSLLGIIPYFIDQEIVKDFNIPGGVNPSRVAEMIKKHNPKAVLITSPNYYGVCSDIEEIASVAHEYNIPVLVDEAHGPHFCTDEIIYPKASMKSGADMCVQSAHKTLNAPNQTAFLHFKSQLIDIERVKAVYSMLQTSSPSYLMCASLDYSACELAECGKKMWGDLYNKVQELKKQLSSYYLILDKRITGQYDVSDVDNSRIVINFSDYECTGFEISKILRTKYNIDIEMADCENIVLIPTPANSKSDFDALLKAMLEINRFLKKKNNVKKTYPLPAIAVSVSPYKAFHGEYIFEDIKNAVGKISASTVISYPPAMPVVIPGCVITQEIADYIFYVKDMGAEIIGLDGEDRIKIIR